jgi:3-amino-4-hydroxybenzoic acid synthase
MKLAWIDVRQMPESKSSAIIEEAIHCGVHAVVADQPAVLEPLPPTVNKVLFPANGGDHAGAVDLLIEPVSEDGQIVDIARGDATEPGRAAFVEITDPATLDLACRCARALPATVMHFKDPTKIPLEIVLAEAGDTEGEVITMVDDLVEADTVLGVLEKGPQGVMYRPSEVGEATRLATLCRGATADLALEDLEVISAEHCGFGDRACVDTCSHLAKDEGLLVGSFSSGMILCCSETHHLPYMPTRPFRVNAGALQSYVVRPGNRTNYLSELHAGSEVLAVGADGRTRAVTVGRVKIESRPLRLIVARAQDGTEVSLALQDDWHVRVLCPGGEVANVTELRPGSRVLGCVNPRPRHVGIAVSEFCLEK